MIDNLYTQRSYVRCISEGYKFLADNLWMLTKVMGPYFLATSALFVVFWGVFTHFDVALQIDGATVTLDEVLAGLLLLLATIVAYCFSLRRLYMLFKRVCGISGKKEINVKKAFRTFFHHIGKIMGTSLLSLFGVAVVSIIIYLPCLISIYTYFDCVEGEVNFGDTTLIPIYGYVMIFLICTLCCAVINICSIAFYATLVFLYGDIRTRK